MLHEFGGFGAVFADIAVPDGPRRPYVIGTAVDIAVASPVVDRVIGKALVCGEVHGREPCILGAKHILPSGEDVKHRPPYVGIIGESPVEAVVKRPHRRHLLTRRRRNILNRDILSLCNISS